MINIEPVEGFEPTTPRLQITCSGQLSYTGIFCSFSNKNYSLFNEVQIYDIFFYSTNKKMYFLKNKLLTTLLLLFTLDKSRMLLYGKGYFFYDFFYAFSLIINL